MNPGGAGCDRVRLVPDERSTTSDRSFLSWTRERVPRLRYHVTWVSDRVPLPETVLGGLEQGPHSIESPDNLLLSLKGWCRIQSNFEVRDLLVLVR